MVRQQISLSRCYQWWVMYDSTKLVSLMQPIKDFATAHPTIKINLGEFSAARVGGTDGNVWVEDVCGYR